MIALQDPAVLDHMDSLDLNPADRVNMFDILDADGSGSLEVRELITGLLQVRGEARKSDAVATLLAVRAVQDMIRRIPPALLLHANGSSVKRAEMGAFEGPLITI